jgi:hypothetical protein
MPSQGWKIGVRLEAGEERMKDESGKINEEGSATTIGGSASG